jgi:hypothetical protein
MNGDIIEYFKEIGPKKKKKPVFSRTPIESQLELKNKRKTVDLEKKMASRSIEYSDKLSQP